MIMVVTMFMMLVPAVMNSKVVAVPLTPALVIAMDPMMTMVPMARHPNVVPTPIPKFRSFVVGLITDVDVQADRFRGRTERRTEPDQDREEC